MVVALLAVLRLPARTMGRRPLCRQIPMSDRERSGQPQQGTATGQDSRNFLSYSPEHRRFGSVVPGDSLRRSAEQLERLGHPKDVTDLLFQIAVEIPVNGDLRNEVKRGDIHDIEHDAR